MLTPVMNTVILQYFDVVGQAYSLQSYATMTLLEAPASIPTKHGIT